MSSRHEHNKLQFACSNVFLVPGGDKWGGNQDRDTALVVARSQHDQSRRGGVRRGAAARNSLGLGKLKNSPRLTLLNTALPPFRGRRCIQAQVASGHFIIARLLVHNV
jgi:hypothetical protein